MTLRYPIALGVMALGLAAAAVVVANSVVPISGTLQELYAVNGVGGQRAMDAIAPLQNLVNVLPTLVGPLVLAAAVPAIGALVLLVLRQRASASATASREA